MYLISLGSGSPLQVGIVETDPFGRSWMNLIIERDWRTQPVGAAKSLSGLLKNPSGTFPDLLLLAADEPLSTSDQEIIDLAWRQQAGLKVILLSNQQPSALLAYLQAPWLGGWLIKNEIGYSLAWACCFAAEGYWVTTPGTAWAIQEASFTLPDRHVMIDGRWLPGNASLAEMEYTRRTLLFHQLIHLEDSPVRKLLVHLGLTPYLNHTKPLDDWFSLYPAPVSSGGRVIARIWEQVKQETPEAAADLAFHLVTTPAISPALP